MDMPALYSQPHVYAAAPMTFEKQVRALMCFDSYIIRQQRCLGISLSVFKELPEQGFPKPFNQGKYPKYLVRFLRAIFCNLGVCEVPGFSEVCISICTYVKLDIGFRVGGFSGVCSSVKSLWCRFHGLECRE